jgi:hypothetical protein
VTQGCSRQSWSSWGCLAGEVAGVCVWEQRDVCPAALIEFVKRLCNAKSWGCSAGEAGVQAAALQQKSNQTHPSLYLELPMHATLS